MGILVSGQADKIARQYRWLNFHPATETQAVQDWFAASKTKFREHQQVYPLVLQGDVGSGRRYLLEAAHFRQTYAGLPVVVFHWDMELRDAPDPEAQFEHMQARLEDFEQQLEMQNPSLWGRLQTLGDAVDAKLSTKFGPADMSVNLKKVFAALFWPTAKPDSGDENANVFDQAEALFRQLLQDSNVILHVRNAELLDMGLLEKLWHTVRWLNDDADAGRGFMGLAFSFPPAFPLAELLGDRARYVLASVMPLSPQRALIALRETFGKRIADDEFMRWLLTHTALHSGVVDAEHLGELLDKLMDEGLLTQQEGSWFFAPADDLERWRKVVGRNIEELWQSRRKLVPADQQSLLRRLFGLAALGGEWIPVDVLLDYLGVNDRNARDDLIDVLDDVYVNASPALLHCADWHFAGMQDQGLVYRFQSPLLTALLIDPATRQEQAHKLLDWLQKRWSPPSRNQAAYLLRLANHAARAVAHTLRERLAWQVESEFAAELQQHVRDKLESGELSVATLTRIMSEHHLVWPMPRRRAICRAWFSYYQRDLRDVTADIAYAGEEWGALWEAVDDSPIPATQEGVSLCYFYGYIQTEAGEYTKAEQLFHGGGGLCKKRPNMDMEARFHSILAHVDYLKGEMDSSEKRLRDFALPMFQKVGNTRSIAVAYGRIADILQARGQLDEALNILENHELPVYEKLGDVRSKAVTMGNIADILQARGQLDEALNIRQTEQLPVYEKLGDVRSKAVTMGKIADILQARGQLDEALNIRENHELPVYEKLGDVREKAVTMGKIADILQSRNKLDSLWQFIWDKKTVPPTEVLEKSFQTLSEIFIIFQSLQNAMQIGRTHSQMADIYQVSGQLDKALELREREIAVFEKSGYTHELLVSRAKLAILLWQMDAARNSERISELFSMSLADARRMKIPEAGQIEEILKKIGLSCDVHV
ncbi:tetratricopeptide repeat protein [Thiothrix nivea]|uniref:Tetratricopeptide TPR_1 repeat-containing protein n=1 Tax=Thiothrix nivea (strain ATCC 35100 / DSM 5205 / JP2) TaxID=870187 RepID=A0A656HE78_THINJ|nr:tetratricopeptide repeat protein [Thiothrix nivea]EIJ34502.1 hypothetical protein Thini_1926 [Thiothrix nivea DSM 5205]